jgi:hypothetical protein
LKKDLPVSTKRKFIKKLSNLFVSIKKSGIEVAKEFFKEGLKEAIK